MEPTAALLTATIETNVYSTHDCYHNNEAGLLLTPQHLQSHSVEHSYGNKAAM